MNGFPGRGFRIRQGRLALAAVVLGPGVCIIGPGVFLVRRDAPPAPPARTAVVVPTPVPVAVPAVYVVPPAPVLSSAPVVAPPAPVPVPPVVPPPVVVTGREVDAASLDVQAGTPRFLPGTSEDEPLSRMPWVSPNVFIKMPQAIGYGPNTTVLSATSTVTGVQTPLRAIEKVIRENAGMDDKGRITKASDGTQNGSLFWPFSPRLSPNGRWLLWQSCARGKPAWTAMTLDGSRRMDWPRWSRDMGGTVGWMRDGVHFVEIGLRGSALFVSVGGLDAPGRTHVFPLQFSNARASVMPGGNTDMCFTTDGHGYVLDGFSKRSEMVPGPKVWTLRPAPLLEARDPALSRREPSDAALSPDGNRLVWHYYPEEHGGRSHFYVSRPDGSAARAIYETADNPGYGVGYSPKWTPDGKGIVFSGRGGLYLLPLYPSAVPSEDAPLRVPLGPFPTRPGEPFTP